MSNKMFIKESRAEKACYAHLKLLSSKTLVTYKKDLTSRQTTVCVVKQRLSNITRFFIKHLIPGVDIKVLIFLKSSN